MTKEICQDSNYDSCYIQSSFSFSVNSEVSFPFYISQKVNLKKKKKQQAFNSLHPFNFF